MGQAGVATRLVQEWWLVLTAACAALALIVASQMTSRLDFLLYDAAQGNAAREVDPSVIIVGIDNRSVAQAGAWPWPRDRVAHLLEKVSEAGPKAIGVDILLLDRRTPPGDEALARSMDGKTPIYLPLQFDVPGANGAQFAVTAPIEPFRARAAALGHVNVAPDRDGLIRRVYRYYTDGIQSWPSLPALMAGQRGAAMPATPAKAGAPARLVGRDPVLIAFAGPAGSFPTVSASSVLKGEVPAEFLRNRRVLIGVTASGIGDVFATPIGADGSLMPGVEVQANVLNTLLAHRAVVPADALATFLLSLLPVLGIMIALRFLSPRWTLLLTVGLAAASLAAAIAVLRAHSFWVSPVSSLIVILLLYPFWTWRKLTLASRYLARELHRSGQPGDLPDRTEPDDVPVDVLDRQMLQLSQAIQQERDLGTFLNDRLSQMPDCILVSNLDGGIVFANEKSKALYAQLNGVGELQYADDLLNFLYCQKPQGRVPIRFFAVPRAPGVPWKCAAETMTGGCFDVRFQPQHNGAHEQVGYIIRIIDNTDVVTTQRQRNDALELLSHDMRAPQSSIISFIDSLAPEDIPPAAADRIRSYAGQTLKLADDFVHLARAQVVELKSEEVDVVALATEAAESLWPQASARHIRFQEDFAEEGHWIMGDPSLLSRMLINLIDNAIKFSPEHGVVTLACREVHVDGTWWARITVANEGEGIPAEHMELLGQRFPHIVPANTGGVGLGLAFVRAAVLRHRGRIGCESIKGQLTTFTIDLPLLVDPV